MTTTPEKRIRNKARGDARATRMLTLRVTDAERDKILEAARVSEKTMNNWLALTAIAAADKVLSLEPTP